MAVQKTRGFILAREDLRETSISLTAYTRDFGKLKLISKGVRTPGEKFIAAYELFALDDIVFYERKKKGFYLLSQCELVNFFPEVRRTLARLSYATYFAELVNYVTELGEVNHKLYELLLNCLELLSGNASPKRVARIFEIRLLTLLGLMPRLRTCASCGRILEKGNSRFSISSGGALCEKCFAKDRRARSLLAGTVNFISDIEELPFNRVKHIKVTKRVGGEVESLLKSFINYHLDVKPKSMEFMEKIGV
jgi:DNA repair protein RecO (recombination protein O)